MIKEYLKSFKPRIDSSIEKMLTRNIKYDDIFEENYIPDKNAIQKSVIDPIYDLLDRGGKRWRPVFMYLCYKAVGGNNEDLIDKFLPFVEIIHNASLVHDDIEDKAEIRRSKACIHKIYGVDTAINCGAVMYFLPLDIVVNSKELNQDQKQFIFELYYHEIKSLHFGQACDIFWHNGKSLDIEYDQYLRMCSCKTGVLARMSAKIGAYLGNGTKEQQDALYNFAEKLGIAFQIQDDILDLKIDENDEFGKIHGRQDIVEGKRTIMVLHTIKNANQEDKERLLELLNKESNTSEEIDEAINIINKHNSIEYGMSVAKQLIEDSWKQVDSVLENSEFKEKLHEFAKYVIDREI